MRNKQRAETCTRNKKKYWACCTILTRIDTIYLQQFSKFAFQEVAHPVGNHTDKFWKFYLPAYALWSPKTDRQASGYTTDLDTRKILILIIYTSYMIILRKNVGKMCWIFLQERVKAGYFHMDRLYVIPKGLWIFTRL